jgi:hypothetical protein
MYPDKPDLEEVSYKTATASMCTMTLSYSIMAKQAAEGAAPTQAPRIPFKEYQKLTKRAVTTTTSTISFYTQVTGCSATNITITTTIATTATPIPRVVIPHDPWSVDGIRTALQQQLRGSALDLFKSRTDQLGTIFFFIPAFTNNQTDAIKGHTQVADAYIPQG